MARVRDAGGRTTRPTSPVRGKCGGWSLPIDPRRLRRPSAALARRRSAACRDLWVGAEFVCRPRHARGYAAPAPVVPRSPFVEPSSLDRCAVAGVRRHAAWWISFSARGAARRRSRGRRNGVDTHRTAASHPFWSRDGRLLYYLPTTPTVDIRNRVVARPSIHSTAASEQSPSTCSCFQR